MHANVLEAIGSPLVRVDSPAGATVAAKIESKNPGGSAKDRPALAMVERAEREGEISPGDALVEPTSGNTGIGLAVVAAAKGYDLTVVMPGSKSPERREIMNAYGADIELVDGDISAAKDRADELEETEGMVQLRQFENPANPQAHYLTTGPEILEAIGDRTVDALVAGVGTGGTITGIGRRLREEFPEMEIVAVEPADNAVLSGGEPGIDDFQGMGPGFVSPNLDTDLIDDVETVTIDAAEAECRRLAREEGILVGQSSGASNLAAKRVAERIADPDAAAEPEPGYVIDGLGESDARGESEAAGDDAAGTIDDPPLVITVFWDSGERYMSTGMFD
ncbi:PLP-dependent cysteine synthase family protein [Halobellus ordinarius]|uniref:PLP-dependent cysteine synthase family protein n=1 Tax=Halobellus ordinarius TaxID=3075120 RepID=UPI00288053F1|nr:PLP-dependent cysteine synthase family protein [Halobellus sp. ZY16]